METSAPVPVEEVLRAERAALRPGGNDAPLTALCISGGGIRSATFALGALQRLAVHGLLPQFDYLSTVSGGGYIGAWLTAWIQRAGGLSHLDAALRPNAEIPPGQPDPIEHLRAYSNYLTPRLGALSADTWTLAATVARNVFLNWLVFIPLLLCALMAPRLVLSFGLAAAHAPVPLATDLGAAAALLLIVCLWNILRYLPGVGGINHTTGDFLARVLTPLVLAAVLFSGDAALQPIHFWPTVFRMLGLCLCAWFGYGVTTGRRGRGGRKGRELASLAGAVIVLGLGLGWAAWWLPRLHLATGALKVTLDPVLLLLAFGLAGAVFVGLSSHTLGTQDREWMARAAAYLGIVCLVWLVACTAVLLAPAWIYGHPGKKWILAAMAVASGWSSSHFGFHAPATAAAAERSGKTGGLGASVLKVAPVLFLAVLAIALAAFTDWVLASSHAAASARWTDHNAVLLHTDAHLALGWALLFLGLGWFMARFININKFSLQGMYRDRLIRAYLGASNSRATANRFTGFSTSDDLAMHTLDPALRPLQVVNMTLNLVSGECLAWQQRKAESFTASALHCGSPGLGYRSAQHYGGRGGITLGTAVAISGAAASPNMGYHSSPLVGFIMTLFNVRLGAWLGNPGAAGDNTWTEAGPVSATRSLLREALGQTTDRSDYVYLSDGGHFENLGLYEMIRRCCRTIVVLDGGCDPGFTYEDLGNALRKIRIDLKVPVKFTHDSLAALRARRQRWAVAKLYYSAVPSTGNDPGDEASGVEDGDLIYIKPMLLGNEPPDVLSYAAAHPSFPHQSTADQWFDESQTESYRMLGIDTVAELLQGFRGGTLADLAQHLAGASVPVSV